jgi:hypothetical protein
MNLTMTMMRMDTLAGSEMLSPFLEDVASLEGSSTGLDFDCLDFQEERRLVETGRLALHSDTCTIIKMQRCPGY